MKKTATAPSPRVFVIQQPKPNSESGWTPDLSTAVGYGAIHFVFGMTDRAQPDPDRAYQRVMDALADFNPERDFLLPMIFGDPATTWVSLQYLAPKLLREGFRSIKYLYWNRGKGEGGMSNENGYYVPCEVPLS